MASKNKKTYLSDLERAKQEFKARTGRKRVQVNSKVFKQSAEGAEYKRVKKNLYNWQLRAEKRRVKEKAAPVEKLVKKGRKPAPTTKKIQKALPDSIIQVIAFDTPFHLVLSYGGKIERAIEDALNEGERLGFGVKLIVLHKAYNGKRVYTSRIAITLALQNLYFDCIRIQDILEDSGLPLIRAYSQDKDGERIITIATVYPEN